MSLRCDRSEPFALTSANRAPTRPSFTHKPCKRRRICKEPGSPCTAESCRRWSAELVVCASTGAAYSSLASQEEARREILRLAAQSSFPATSPALEASLKSLVASPTPQGGQKTLQLGQGTWEVISAPHIARLSETLGTTFSPIRYSLKGDKIASNVRYNSSVFKEGWLSASGTLLASAPDTVQVKFDKFWVDFGVNGLREDLTGTQADAFGDSAIGWIGRLFFFPQFSLFPVLYVDSELAVFAFPPLRSNIAVRKIS